MGIEKTEIAKTLIHIIERLDELATDPTIVDVDDEVEFRTDDYEDVPDNNSSGQIDSEFLINEDRIDKITEVLNEEIENLRRLVEIIEEGS